MGKRLWAAALALTLCALGPAAHGGAPPDALLVTGTDSGDGVNYGTTTWTERKTGYCTVRVARGGRHWEGPPVQWVPGTEIAVRFDTPRRPSEAGVVAYLLGDPTTGTVIYGRVDVPHELRRTESGKAWEAVLSPPPWPDLYLDVTARWRDRDGCGMQESGWTFRAGLLPI